MAAPSSPVPPSSYIERFAAKWADVWADGNNPMSKDALIERLTQKVCLALPCVAPPSSSRRTQSGA